MKKNFKHLMPNPVPIENRALGAGKNFACKKLQLTVGVDSNEQLQLSMYRLCLVGLYCVPMGVML